MRRFEILLPLQFNDGSDIQTDLLSDAIFEMVDHFGSASYYNNIIEGRWTHEGDVFQDSNSKLVVDVPDTDENRQWMRDFKLRWKDRLEQLDLWLISFEIDID
jgi:hypothetical protein